MCGIFGCTGKLSMEKAWECLHTISHRGPDAQHVKALEGAVLAHARLSILDTSASANQPMADVSGRYWIVYNGELYNYIELRKELEEKGYPFRTAGDTEVMLYAYIEWGEEFQLKCNGMWGLAIWDDLKKTLFLSRDRFGIKPLYYYEQDGQFYFASEMKAFFPIMRHRTVNYQIFAQNALLRYEATKECCILGIQKILAGHCGVYEKNRLSVRRWWDTLAHVTEAPRTYQKQVERLTELFLDACRIRMRSDVPIGTALSGGVDSSAVAGAMRKIADGDDSYVSRDWQHTFVASMPGTSIDETAYAQAASDYIGVDLKKVEISGKISPQTLYRYMYLCEDPYLTPPVPFMQTYGSMADAGIKVTIDGHGADELFGGYTFDLWHAGKDMRNSPRRLKRLLQVYNDAVTEEEKVSWDQMLCRMDALEGEEGGESWKTGDALNRRLYEETHRQTLPTLFRCYDRYSMGNGVEIRMPFMDWRIVCFAFSIPWTSKIRNGYTKSIVRDTAAQFMDRDVIFRKRKIGFNSPVTEWFSGEWKEFLFDTVHSRDFYECGLIHPLEVCMKVQKFYSGNHSEGISGEQLWGALVPYFWKKAVIDA